MKKAISKKQLFQKSSIVCLITMMLFIVSACDYKQAQNQTHQTQQQGQSGQTVSRIQSKEIECDTAEQLLNEIYQKQTNVVNLDLAELNHYFSDSLANFIHKDIQCSRENDGVCSIEFDIFTDSQDPNFQSYKIKQSQSVKHYDVVLENDGEQTKIKIEMSQGGCPKIDNIYYQEGNLKQILSDKL